MVNSALTFKWKMNIYVFFFFFYYIYHRTQVFAAVIINKMAENSITFLMKSISFPLAQFLVNAFNKLNELCTFNPSC